MESSWLTGPEFFESTNCIPPPNDIEIPSDEDPELRQEVVTKVTEVNANNVAVGLGAKRFERFSNFLSLQRAIATLIVEVRKFKQRKNEPNRTVVEKNVIATPKCRSVATGDGGNSLGNAKGEVRP